MRRLLSVLPLLTALLSLGACAPEGPSGFVTFNVAPNSQCIYSPDIGGSTFFPIGHYDIATGGSSDLIGGDRTDNCEHPYIVHLLVNSFLRPNADTTLGRAEPNILQLQNAEVKLMSIQRQPIRFTNARREVVLPNPFLVTTNNSLFPASGSTPATGIAAVEVIPSDYAGYLEMFIGGQILAEIQIFGTTTGDVDVEFKPFVYPIEICDGCMTLCGSVIEENMLTEDEVIRGECPDNAGADGRVCIDPEC
jgi:hypothetical protein